MSAYRITRPFTLFYDNSRIKDNHKHHDFDKQQVMLIQQVVLACIECPISSALSAVLISCEVQWISWSRAEAFQ